MKCKEKLQLLERFGISINSRNDTVMLSKDLYTEGGKNSEVHKETFKLRRYVKKLEKLAGVK